LSRTTRVANTRMAFDAVLERLREQMGNTDIPEVIKSVIESFGFVAIFLGGLATGGRLQQAGYPLAGRDLVDFGSL
jgi:hypothetical protein